MTDQVPMKVLVIESVGLVRDELVNQLAQVFPHAEIHSYDPISAGRPGDDFNWSRFDVLILDYQLGPGENGLDWLRRFKKESNRFPATILLTGAENEEVAVKALRYGAHDFLRKQGITAAKLAESVADALNVRYRESSAESSLTLNASKFSKSYFYGQLDLAFEEAEREEPRVLLMIRVDGYDALRKSLGVLAMEDVTRHLANVGIELFRFHAYRPRATRFSDASIGILTGGFESISDLEDTLSTYSRMISEQPPIVNDAPIPVGLSIGAVVINSRSLGVYGLFEHAEQAVVQASKKKGDAFVVVNPDAPRIRRDADTAEIRTIDPNTAIRENRIQAMFSPITPVSDRLSRFDLREFFEIDPYFISPAGERVAVSAVFARSADDSLWSVIDRWSIRECVSRQFSHDLPDNRAPAFLIDVSALSMTDKRLPRWVANLFKYHGNKRKRGELILAVDPATLMRDTNAVVSNCNQLHSRHGFHFVLKEIEDSATCKVCLAQFKFDLIVLSRRCTQVFVDSPGDASDCARLLEYAAEKELLTVARGIQDVNALHAVITAGVDFVQGDFVAPEQEEIEAAIGIETVHLGSGESGAA